MRRASISSPATTCEIELKKEKTSFSIASCKANKENPINYVGAYLIHLMTLCEKQKRKEALAHQVYKRMNDELTSLPQSERENYRYALLVQEKLALIEINNSAFIFESFRNFQQYKVIDVVITKESARFVIGDFALIENKDKNKLEIQALNGVSIDDIYKSLLSRKFEVSEEYSDIHKINKLCEKDVIASEDFDCTKFHGKDGNNENIILIPNLGSYRDLDYVPGTISAYKKEFEPKPDEYLSALTCTVIANFYRSHDKCELPPVEKAFEHFEAAKIKKEKQKKCITEHLNQIKQRIECNGKYEATLNAMATNRVQVLEKEISVLNAQRQRIEQKKTRLHKYAFWRSYEGDCRALEDEIDLKKQKVAGITALQHKLEKNGYRVEVAIKEVLNDPDKKRMLERRQWGKLPLVFTLFGGSRTKALLCKMQREEAQHLVREAKREAIISSLRQSAHAVH